MRRKGPPELPPRQEIYFEFVAIGGSVKCTAIDPLTGREVSVIGPASALPRDLERLALAKLMRRLARDEGGA